ncbi:lipocalin family protein [Mucilaginibacter phyllosphaerae]
MKNKNFYFFLSVLLIVAFFTNSCKKEKQNYIPTLFATGTWQLSSILESKYLGDSRLSLDTLQCDTTQFFTFNKDDMTCTYTNFDCVDQEAKGTWQLSDTRLFLFADMTVKDGSQVGTSKPFLNARIINVGEYSLVLEAGDIQTYYTATDRRTIRRYGFVRIKPVTAN